MKIALLLITTFLFLAPPAQATAGFAEWYVNTPGGHTIRHMDGWLEEHGDCLTDEAGKVFVSHLKTWRYYEGFVAGEDGKGFFLFSEGTQEINRFETRPSLDGRLQSVGTPLSDWLVGQDGFIEAYYPMYWGVCKHDRDKSKELLGDQVDCNEITSVERRNLYKRTTWTKQCAKFRKEIEKSTLGAEGNRRMLEFCEQFGPLQVKNISSSGTVDSTAVESSASSR